MIINCIGCEEWFREFFSVLEVLFIVIDNTWRVGESSGREVRWVLEVTKCLLGSNQY